MYTFFSTVRKSFLVKALDVLMVAAFVLLPFSNVPIVRAEDEVAATPAVDVSTPAGDAVSPDATISGDVISDTTNTTDTTTDTASGEVLGVQAEDATPADVQKEEVAAAGVAAPLGSIRVCKILTNSQYDIVPGNAGHTFSMSFLEATTSQGSQVAIPSTTTWTTPLTYNTDLLSTDENGNDAMCTTYSELPMGNYYYGEETISDPVDFSYAKYNDSTEPTELGSFGLYSGELFDGNGDNDGDRDTNRDGHIVLTTDRPNRTLVVWNKMEETKQGGQCDPKQNLISNGSFEAPTVTDGGGWDIFGNGSPFLDWTVGWTNPLSYLGSPIAQMELQKTGLAAGWAAYDDNQWTELDSDWNGHSGSLNGEDASTKIYEDVPTIPGQKYTLSFAHSPRPGADATENILEAKWDGGFLGSWAEAGGGTTSWTKETFTDLVATGATTRVQFSDLGVGNSVGTFLDDVRLYCQPTIKDDSKSTITVTKVVVNSNEPVSSFPLWVGDKSVTSGVSSEFAPGSYTITETNDLPNYSATYSGDCNPKGELTLGENENKSCTITNTYTPPNRYGPYCGDGIKNQPWEQCDGTEGCTVQCQSDDQCTEKAFAKIDLTNVSNTGVGDMTTDQFIGGKTLPYKIPNNTWFEIYDGSNWISDAGLLNYSDVPGLAVQRSPVNKGNSLRVRLFGDNPKDNLEHAEGYIEFFNTNLVSQANDLQATMDTEKPFGAGMSMDPANDELWMASGKSFFWLTTTMESDSFYSNLSKTFGCEQAAYCGDGIVGSTVMDGIQDWEQCDGGQNCTAQCQFVDQCTNKAFAQVNVENFDNIGPGGVGDGVGNMTSDVYIGGNTPAYKVPTGTWVEIYDGTNWITDSNLLSYSNVPGLALQRLNGKLRLRMYGNNPQDNKEHVDGNIKLFNTTVTSLSNETQSTMEMEKPTTDGIGLGLDANNDEFSTPDSTTSAFYMTTVMESDTYYTNLSTPEQCGDDDGGTTGQGGTGDDGSTTGDATTGGSGTTGTTAGDTTTGSGSTGTGTTGSSGSGSGSGAGGSSGAGGGTGVPIIPSADRSGGSGGVVLGASTTDLPGSSDMGQVLGDSLAQTGMPVSFPMVLSVILAIMTLVVARKEKFA